MKVGACLVVVALAGCGDDYPPRVHTCSAAWQTVLPFQQGRLRRSGMAVHDERIFISAGNARQTGTIDIVPAAGGTRLPLTDGDADALWIDGDRLMFAQGDRLSAVALGGGEPTLVLDGNTTGISLDRFSYVQELDATHFYWTTLQPGRPSIAWRMPRTGGVAEQLATLPEAVFEILVLGPEQILTADRWSSSALVFPRAGGATRALATLPHGHVVGADQGGVIQRQSDRGDLTLWRVPISGETPRRFWRDMPREFRTEAAWPDGVGGWILWGTERFDVGPLGSVWAVTAEGHGQRLGCSPSAQRGDYAHSHALAPDGVYLALMLDDANSDERGWQIIRVPRRP